MKKYFEIIGILAFALFSFYYTDKVTNIMNSKDPIMISINEYKSKYNNPCREGYITNEGVVLGKNGDEINVIESYSNMQGKVFDEDKLVFDKLVCKVSLDTLDNDYIINVNPTKNVVNIFLKVENLEYINDILKVYSSKNAHIDLLVNGKLISENKEYFKELYNNGYTILYNGTNEKDYKLFYKTIKDIDNKVDIYYMSIGNEELNIKSKAIRLKTSYYYSNNILLNTQKNLEKGSFIIFKENKNTLEESSSVINYIKAKKIDIIDLKESLK